MEQIIIGYLLQHGHCPLPGIGIFHIKHHSAFYDITNKTMNPPIDAIEFEENPAIKTHSLIETISLKKSVNKDAARSMLDKFCLNIKDQLDLGNPVKFESLGVLRKNSDHKIGFTSIETTLFLRPIPAEKTHNQTPQHTVLVGDDTIQASDSNNDAVEETVKKKWPLWQYIILILILLSLAFGIYYFYKNGFNVNTIGNHNPISVPDPPKTYK